MKKTLKCEKTLSHTFSSGFRSGNMFFSLTNKERNEEREKKKEEEERQRAEALERERSHAHFMQLMWEAAQTIKK